MCLPFGWECLGTELWGNQLRLKENHTEIGVNLLYVPSKLSRKVKRSGLDEAEGIGCTKWGESTIQRMGCRNRNLTAQLCFAFTIGKITRNDFCKFQTVHLGNGLLKVWEFMLISTHNQIYKSIRSLVPLYWEPHWHVLLSIRRLVGEKLLNQLKDLSTCLESDSPLQQPVWCPWWVILWKTWFYAGCTWQIKWHHHATKKINACYFFLLHSNHISSPHFSIYFNCFLQRS